MFPFLQFAKWTGVVQRGKNYSPREIALAYYFKILRQLAFKKKIKKEKTFTHVFHYLKNKNNDNENSTHYCLHILPPLSGAGTIRFPSDLSDNLDCCGGGGHTILLM
jgi:hypothetical protein